MQTTKNTGSVNVKSSGNGYYVRAFETAHTCPDVTLVCFSRYSEDYARDVAFSAAEKALQDLDLSRKAGQLSRRYYFRE